MRARIPLAIRNIIIAIGVGVLVAPLAATSASADDDDVVIVETKIPYIVENPTNPGLNYIQINGTGSIVISQSAAVQTDLKPQCVFSEGSGGNTLCLGQQSAIDPTQTALNVGGVNEFLESTGKDHFSALGWITKEAVDAVTALYDLPYDGRVSVYAADQIRAYVVSRILDILDKSLYGEPLSADEQKTLAYINKEFLTTDQKIARWALEEHDAYLAAECGYTPAPAPSFITEPVGLPQTVIDWCSRRHSALESAFVFAPPIPTAEHFQAWGLYRHVAELGLDRFSTPEMQESMAETYRAVIGLSGIAAAAGGAVLAGAAIGSSVAASSFVAGAIGSAAVTTTFGASLSSMAAAVTTVGTIAAASIVAIVVIAVIITAVAIWQLVEHEEVGVKLRERVADADKAAEPFGLDQIRDEFAGLDLREGLTAGNLPSYRTAASVARIVEIITAATTNTFTGVYLPDPTSLWADNASTAEDFRFIITDSAGTRVSEVLTVPIADVDTTVRFSKGWMIVDAGQGEKAALEFGFVDPEGRKSLATRAPTTVGGFTVTAVPATGAATSESRTAIEFLDRNGELVTAQLVPQSTSELGGPLPSAVGPLTPGRTVILRPNPVDVDGHFDLDKYVTGYEYLWEVQRYDADAGMWVEAVPPASSYDTRFIPTAVGSHRASVRMHDIDPLDGIDADVWGLVEFDVVPPAVDILSLELTDDGSEELQLSAQLGAQVPSNDYALTVQWPGTVTGAPGSTSSVDLTCHTVDPLSCSTVDTDLFPELKSALAHTLPLDADLTQGVQVTIADRFGAGVTRTFPIDDPARPTLAPPRTAPTPEQPGVVVFDPELTAVQVPVQVAVNPNYELARIVPGGDGTGPMSFGIIDPADGLPKSSVAFADDAVRVSAGFDSANNEWVLDLRVTAGLDDLGSFTVPIVVQQVPGPTRTTLPLSVDLVPSSGERYRGAVANEIDPLNIAVDTLPELVPYVMGGRDEWGDYAGDLCVSVEFTEFPTPPVERCGPVADLLDENGRLEPLTFPEFDPDGLDTGRYEVTAWIPTGERSDETPFTVSFRLLSGPPVVDGFTWDRKNLVVRFTATPFSEAAAITGYSCRLDGSPVACPDATSGTWSGAMLAAGAHTFELSVTDASGNYTTAGFDFDVKKDPKAKPTKPPKPPKP